jgi:hypothetical protein
MAAPKGNQFWKARSKHGRDLTIADPDQLWDSAVEYFEWVEANPLWEAKVAQYQGEPVEMTVPKMRAMTLEGLWLYTDVTKDIWYTLKTKNDFSEVVTRIENVIKSQKFAGAAADLLNPNIIARDLGLKDASTSEHKVTVSDLTDEEIDRRLQALIDESG